VAEKLASFVAKNGENFEDVTKQRNPGDTPFKFLFDKNCNDYLWYRMKLREFRGDDKPAPGAGPSSRPQHANADNNNGTPLPLEALCLVLPVACLYWRFLLSGSLCRTLQISPRTLMAL